MTASQPRSAAAVLSESAMSPTTWSPTSTPICAALVCRRSGFRTRNLTWCPPSWAAFAVHAPTNPVPPVIRTFIRPASPRIADDDRNGPVGPRLVVVVRRIHRDQLRPVVGAFLVGGIARGQLQHLFFDLHRHF